MKKLILIFSLALTALLVGCSHGYNRKAAEFLGRQEFSQPVEIQWRDESYVGEISRSEGGEVRVTLSCGELKTPVIFVSAEAIDGANMGDFKYSCHTELIPADSIAQCLRQGLQALSGGECVEKKGITTVKSGSLTAELDLKGGKLLRIKLPDGEFIGE